MLDVSPPAVNRMVNRLSKQGLLHHQRYQGIAITESGRVEALKHIRKQRVAEVFLVQVMGMSWLEVHEEARRLSDGLSEAVVQRMVDMTDKPATCPHGEPIPLADGTLPPATDVFLSEMKAPETVIRVSRLITRESDRLQYIEALGLVPGATSARSSMWRHFDGPDAAQAGARVPHHRPEPGPPDTGRNLVLSGGAIVPAGYCLLET